MAIVVDLGAHPSDKDADTLNLHPFARADEYVERNGLTLVRCGACGTEYGIGDAVTCPHGKAQPHRGFEPYFDHGLGEYVTGWGDVRKAMRENHLDYRDHPSAGETSARRDRIREQQRKAAGR